MITLMRTFFALLFCASKVYESARLPELFQWQMRFQICRSGKLKEITHIQTTDFVVYFFQHIFIKFPLSLLGAGGNGYFNFSHAGFASLVYLTLDGRSVPDCLLCCRVTDVPNSLSNLQSQNAIHKLTSQHPGRGVGRLVKHTGTRLIGWIH